MASFGISFDRLICAQLLDAGFNGILDGNQRFETADHKNLLDELIERAQNEFALFALYCFGRP
jgi:hypothetical protein